MCGVKIKSVHSVKDLGVTVASNLKFSQHCNESVKKKSKQDDGFHLNIFSLKNKGVILPLYNSFVRHHLYVACRAVLVSLPCERHC